MRWLTCTLALLASVRPAAAQRCDAAPAGATAFLPAMADPGRLFRGAFSPDGRELYFFKKTGALDSEDYRIFVSRSRGDAWSSPERVTLGDEASDLYPAVSPDGTILVFASYRRAPGDTLARPNASLWMSRREGEGWGPPQAISTLARHGFYHAQVTFTPDARLHFRRITPDWSGTVTLTSTLANGAFTAPVENDDVMRWTTWRTDAVVRGGDPTPDGTAVLLDVSLRNATARRPGPSDIWITNRTAAGWTEPVPLGLGVNDAEQFDTFPFVSPDGCRLIWTRGFSTWHQVSWPAVLRDVAARRPDR